MKMFILMGLTLVLGASSTATANAPEPPSYRYHSSVEGNSVFICPVAEVSANPYGCPMDGGLLRQDSDTGQVIVLGDNCQTLQVWKDTSCYVDQCVPPGNYRYGFAKPFDCDGNVGFIETFVDVEVTASIEDCTVGTGSLPARDFNGELPWTDGFYRHCDNWESDYEGPGCSSIGATGTVVGLQIGCIFAGLLLALRRRRT